MKIVFQNVISLLFFVAYNYLSLAQDKKIEVDVAAFFNQDSQAQLAFETAIHNFNRMQDGVRFNAMSISIPEVDSFGISNFMCNLTETNTIGGVICPTFSKTTPIMESISVNLEIPVVQLHWRNFQPFINNSVTVNFHPDPTLLFQGYGVIVRNLQWRSIVIFYETTENLIRLQDVLKIQTYDLNLKYNTLMMFELGKGPDYRSALKQLQGKSEHRIILDCKTENVLSVLSQAKELGLLERQYSYFLTSLDAHTLDLEQLKTSANITTVRIVDPEDVSFQDAVSRWQKHKWNGRNGNLDPYSITLETALMYDAINTYIKTVGNLVAKGVQIEPQSLSCRNDIKPWENGLLIASVMKTRDSETESFFGRSITGPMKFDAMGRRTNFTLYVVEGYRENVVAVWNPQNLEERKQEVEDRLKFLKSEEDRSKELEKKWSQGIVTVASILGSPYLMERKRPENSEPLQGNARYEGFSMDLISALAEELNIRFRFEVRKDTFRGAYSKETKSWNGLVRDILDGKAELAICDLTITPERREAVDFSTPFMRLGISILYQKDTPEPANMYGFLDPLGVDLWMYSATIYLASTVVLFFVARVSSQDWENPHPCNPEPEELENIWGLKNCFWLTLGSIMNQGCDILPKGVATRMIASMWWFFGIIITNSYMANLAAFLTNKRSQNAINSAEDLAKQNKVKYGTMRMGSTEGFFRDSNYSTYHRMWTTMQQDKPSAFEKSNDDGVSRVQNTKERGYAFLMESPTLEYQIQTKCDLMQVGNWLDNKGYGIAMPMDYPHRSRINEALLTLQEKGVINQLKNKWWKEKREEKLCSDDKVEDDASLALENVGGVFIVLGVGIALSYVVGICEFLWNVKKIAVEEHIPFWEAFKIEVKFALNVTVSKKRAKPKVSSSSSSSRSSRSRSATRSFLQNAGSFLRLDNLNRIGTPGSSGPTSRNSSRPLN